MVELQTTRVQKNNRLIDLDSRSIFLSRELQQIENNKQKYKEDNNLYDIMSDASVNIQQKFK